MRAEEHAQVLLEAVRTQHHNKARSARAAAARADKTCEACGRPFTPKRVDARTCSPACRQKLYRLEKARATPVR